MKLRLNAADINCVTLLTVIAKERSHIVGEQLWLSHSTKVSSARNLGPMCNVHAALGILARHFEVLSKRSDSGWRFYSLATLEGRFVTVLKIRPGGRVGGFSQPIDHDIGDELIFGKPSFEFAVTVAERSELVKQPGSQTYGRVVESVG